MKAEGFGYKNAWIAFRTEEPEPVARALGLRNTRASDWTTGIAAAYEYPVGRSVFVTPPLDGWVLCVGFPLVAAVAARPPVFATQAAAWATRLGCEVQYFSTHRVTEAHGWARVRPGGPVRAYVYVGESGEKVLDEGPPTAEERELGFAFFDPTSAEAATDDYWGREDLQYPGEEQVMALAGRWSLDPSSLGDREGEVGPGLVGEYGEPPASPRVPESGAKRSWRFW